METNKKLMIKIDYRIISVFLVVIIVAMLALWRPWVPEPSTDRKVTVTGQATIKAEPDEYQFSPYYERDTTAEITALNEQLLKGLKELGVTDSQIKNNASRYGAANMSYSLPEPDKEVSTLGLTITLDNKELVQKVQDYLISTNPRGSISPYATFSTAKQKQLQDEARDKAITDAKARAEKTVSALGAKLGKVQEIGEGQQGGVYPMLASDMAAPDKASATSLSVQPGQNDFSYSVNVTFLLK